MDECENCNLLEGRIERMSTDVEALQNQNMANLRVIGQLRQSLAEHIEGEPEGDDVKRLLLLWRDVHFEESERSKVNVRLDGPRALRVRWALKRYKAERVENAIRGAFHDDWAMGRDSRTRGRRYNDIAKHILKDEESIERFERLVHGKPAPDPQAGDIDRFVALLEGLRATRPGQWEARCPAHEDRIASLSVGQGRKGIVVHCQAGCSVEQVAGSVGWPVVKLFAPEPVAVVERPVDSLPTEAQVKAMTERLANNPRLLARVYELRRWNIPELRALGIGFDGERLTFPIRDTDGNLINILRYKPGERQKAERKMLASRGRQRDLFPQPELYKTDPLWLVEGEPDAVTGIGLDLSAVAVPGASTWRPEWGERMKDRTVYVCFDCDQPGRQHAARVALALACVAHEVRVVDLDPAREDGFDLSDFFCGHGTIELLGLIAEKAGVVRSHRRAA
jgi:hypothetical protein